MACKARENGKVLDRGRLSIEWYKDGKPQYYCYGYIDKRTDELLPECRGCRSHVYKAQDDLDAWNRREAMAEYIEREATLYRMKVDIAPPFKVVAEMPAADVVPVRHGRWKPSGSCEHRSNRKRNTDKWTTYKCSECGFSNGRRFRDNFCPNCGAKMDKEVEENGE